MQASATVLVVDDGGRVPFEEALAERDLAVDVATDVGAVLGTGPANWCCVVCRALPGHTTSELVTTLTQGPAPVVFVYEDETAATAALDAGAAAAVPQTPDDGAWTTHLAATVDGVRRRDPDRRENAPMLTAALDEIHDIFFVVGVDGTFLRWNQQLVETTGYGHEEVRDMHPTDFFEGADVSRIEDAIGRVVTEGRATLTAGLTTRDGESIPHEFTGALIDAGGTRAIVGTARDIRDRLDRERELEARTQRLEVVNHVNAVIRDVTGVLLEAETREAIVQTVPEKLVTEDTYRFAWVGSYDADAGHLHPDAWAGDGAGYLDERPTGEGTREETVTALSAVQERSVVFAQNVAEAPEAEEWREAALAHGHHAAAAIPLVYNDVVYGCLCLYADRSDAFDPLEREVLAELGEIIGHAIHAAETRRALTADTVTEVQLRVAEEGSFLVQAADLAGAELELVGSVSRPDGAIIQLFTVRGVDAPAVREFADAVPAAVEVVTERAAECVLKVTNEGPSIAHVLAEVGGTVTAITTASEEARVRVELPQNVAVGGVLETVRDRYDVELLSQRQVTRESTTNVAFRADVERRLTDRQLEVLGAAYEAGFFAWPREQSGQEVADVLDVTPPTFHEHLRVGERKLLDVLFDAGPLRGTTVVDPGDGAADGVAIDAETHAKGSSNDSIAAESDLAAGDPAGEEDGADVDGESDEAP